MELGQYQLQIFVSLVVILGAAFVALICDFLKGNNEQLRELVIELKARGEEEGRRVQSMTAHAPTVPASSPTREIGTRLAKAEPRRAASPEAIAAMERGAKLAGTPSTTATGTLPVTRPVAQLEAPARAVPIQDCPPSPAAIDQPD